MLHSIKLIPYCIIYIWQNWFCSKMCKSFNYNWIKGQIVLRKWIDITHTRARERTHIHTHAPTHNLWPPNYFTTLKIVPTAQPTHNHWVEFVLLKKGGKKTVVSNVEKWNVTNLKITSLQRPIKEVCVSCSRLYILRVKVLGTRLCSSRLSWWESSALEGG